MQLNGLLTSNSWAGYHILLNPDYSAATQWRFVNRAIDEVENDRVRRTTPPQTRASGHHLLVMPFHLDSFATHISHNTSFGSSR